MDFINTEKNRPSLLDSGYQYIFEKKYNLTSYWRCTEVTNKKCKARIHSIDGNIVKRLNEHCHPASAVDIATKHFVSNIKELAVCRRESGHILIAEGSSSITSTVATHIPVHSSLKRTIQRIRQKSLPVSPLSLLDLVIPDEFKITHNDELFLIYDSGPVEQRILLFSSPNFLKVLCNSENWFCDGTFSTVPLLFKQLFTVHALKEKLSIPLLFALLPGKSANIYKEVFNQILKLFPQTNPKSIMSDFELSIVKAEKEVFPQTAQKFCFFHFGQNIYRKLTSENLKKNYDNDPEFSYKVKMIMSLAFVPPQYVTATFEEITAEPEFMNENKLNVLIDYIEDNYIGRYDVRLKGRRIPLFPIETWNQYISTINDCPRTNNSLEGWHRGFSTLVGTHPSIWSFLKNLKLEQSNNEIVVEQINSGYVPPQKKNIKITIFV